MTKEEFNFACRVCGDPNLPDKDKWKSIKSIFVENPLVDTDYLMNNGEFIYIDNDNIGPGFYILGTSDADIEPINNSLLIHYIPLILIDKITFKTDYTI